MIRNNITDQHLTQLFNDLMRDHSDVLTQMTRFEAGTKIEKIHSRLAQKINIMMTTIQQIKTLRKQLEDL